MTCQHVACDCDVTSPGGFCDPVCMQSTEQTEICGCPHPECTGSGHGEPEPIPGEPEPMVGS
jgi:hypothetical protein